MVADPVDELEVDEHISPEEDLNRAVVAALVNLDTNLTVERFTYASRNLKEEYLDRRYMIIWRMISRYYNIAGASPEPSEFDELIGSTQTIPLPDKVEIASLYRNLWDTEGSDAKFRFAIYRLGEIWRDSRLISSTGIAQQMMTGSVKIGSQNLSGREDAVSYLHGALGEIEGSGHDESASGDINLEGSKIIEAYFAAKRGEIQQGCLTGFDAVDEITGGVKPGELWLIAGYTSEGKSKIAFNIAWNACYLHGKNVLFACCEPTRQQVHRNLLVRHSHLEKFGRKGGLRYKDVWKGTLSSEDEVILKNVVADMRDWGNQGYGHMYVFSLAEKASVGEIGEALRRESRSYHVDLVVVDYLGLLGGSSKRGQRREELDDVMVAAKRLAVDAYGGSGVAVLSPWQISREAWKEAQSKGVYQKSALSDTSQAEKSSDVVISILRKDDDLDRLQAQILKNRDGEAGAEFELMTDFATSYVGSGAGGAGMAGMLLDGA